MYRTLSEIQLSVVVVWYPKLTFSLRIKHCFMTLTFIISCFSSCDIKCRVRHQNSNFIEASRYRRQKQRSDATDKRVTASEPPPRVHNAAAAVVGGRSHRYRPAALVLSIGPGDRRHPKIRHMAGMACDACFIKSPPPPTTAAGMTRDACFSLSRH